MREALADPVFYLVVILPILLAIGAAIWAWRADTRAWEHNADLFEQLWDDVQLLKKKAGLEP
jgi:hypothetical protein